MTKGVLSMRKHYWAGIRAAAAAALVLGTSAGSLSASAAQLRMGDVNFNNVVDANDASMILRCYVSRLMGKNVFDAKQLRIADIDHNNVVDGADAGAVLHYYVSRLAGHNPAWEYFSDVPQSDETVTIGTRKFKLGGSIAELNAQYGNPTEKLTEKHQNAFLTYYVYQAGTQNLVIGIANGDKLVGVYAFGKSFSYSGSGTGTTYTDDRAGGKVYAGMAVMEGFSADAGTLAADTGLDAAAKISFHITNAYRAMNGLAPLGWSDKAAGVAFDHSLDMAKNNYFEHGNVGQRLENAGINWNAYAENISAGYANAFAATHGWITSKSGHRENILTTKCKYLGIGFANHANTRNALYATQDFYSEFT